MDEPPGIEKPKRRIFHNKVTGERVTWIKYGYETQGQYTLARVTCAPGGGPPPHWHRSYAEHFTCIKGTMGILKGGETLFLEPGQDADVPIGTVHRFFNDPDKNAGEMIELEVRVTPARPGLEKGLEILFGLANDDLCNGDGVPRNLVHAAMFSGPEMSDTIFTGVAGGAMNAMVAVLGAYGRWMGQDKELLKRYWYEPARREDDQS